MTDGDAVVAGADDGASDGYAVGDGDMNAIGVAAVPGGGDLETVNVDVIAPVKLDVERLAV